MYHSEQKNVLTEIIDMLKVSSVCFIPEHKKSDGQGIIYDFYEWNL